MDATFQNTYDVDEGTYKSAPSRNDIFQHQNTDNSDEERQMDEGHRSVILFIGLQ